MEAAVAGKNLRLAAVILGLSGIAIFLYFAFSGTIQISPVLFVIGRLSIRWYGVLIAAAVYLSYLIISKRYARYYKDNNFELIFLVILFSGLIGARIGFVIQNSSYYSSHIADIFKIYQGGLSIHGAIIAGVIALAILSRVLHKNFFALANLISPEVILSIAIGRWGNFFNQEIIGQPTDNFIKMYVSPTARPAGFEGFSFFHPVFLYESLILFALYLFLISNPERVKKYGLIYLLIGYCVARIVVEFFRIDYKPIFAVLDLAQWVSFGIIIITIITLTLRRK